MPTEGVIRPWEANPYQLLSWWDMEIFSAHEFYQMARVLEILARVTTREELQAARREYSLPNAFESCRKLGLRMSLLRFEALVALVDQAGADLTLQEIQGAIRTLQIVIQDEMRLNLFFHLKEESADFYRQPKPLLGGEVSTKWPTLVEDISEAGKCMALARYTAAVFHLMRVVEVGVQEFGKKLGVALPTEKPWGNILTEAKAPIDALPKGHTDKAKLSEAWAHLDAVRLAWRNEVMHPKQTYTEEEATDVFNHVRTYMRHLVTIL